MAGKKIKVCGVEYDSIDEIPEALTMPLRKPVKIGDQIYEALNLREPTAGECSKMARKAETDPTGALIDLISMVSGIAPPIIEKIGVRDMREAGQYLAVFTNPGQATGTES